MEKERELEKPTTFLLKPGTFAVHNGNKYDTLPKGELIVAFRETDTHYIGNYAQPFGMLAVNTTTSSFVKT